MMAKKHDSDFSPAPAVDKLAITKRLEREGRWDEARLIKDAMIKEFRAKGMTKELAGAHAWNEIDKMYPPLPVEEPEPEPAVAEAEAEVEDLTGEDVAELVSQHKLPWDGLPTSADFDAEVSWVYQQYPLVVIERSGKSSVLAWQNATEPPPSVAATGLMQWAAKNQTKFYDSMVPKIMAKKSDQEDEIIKREKLAVEEIAEMLSEMEARFEERGVCPKCRAKL